MGVVAVAYAYPRVAAASAVEDALGGGMVTDGLVSER